MKKAFDWRLKFNYSMYHGVFNSGSLVLLTISTPRAKGRETKAMKSITKKWERETEAEKLLIKSNWGQNRKWNQSVLRENFKWRPKNCKLSEREAKNRQWNQSVLEENLKEKPKNCRLSEKEADNCLEILMFAIDNDIWNKISLLHF